MRRLLCLTALMLCLASCQAKPFLAGPSPPLESEGAVFVYLVPLPQEVERLSFALAELYAKRADGGRVPLPLRLMTIDPGTAGRERLLADGALPPGPYAGLSLRVEKAALKGEGGAAALHLPEEMTEIDVPFTVERRRAVVLDLTLHYRDSVREGFRFVPAFTASIPRPGMLAAGRIGLSTSRDANAVTVFDKVSGRVFSVLPTGEAPVGVAMDPARRRVYMALAGEDAVEAVDLLDMRLLERLRLAGGDGPLDLALTPDGRTLLVANSGSNTVSVIEAPALIETGRIPVGSAPQTLLLDGAGRRAYIFNALSNTISVLDVPRRAVAATISTESGPFRGSLGRDGRRLYFLQPGSPYLGVVDTSSLAVERGAYVGRGAEALKVDPRTGWIYLAKRGSPDVEVYDPTSLLPVDFIPVEGEASYLTIDGEENTLWVVSQGSDRILAVGLANKRTGPVIDVGRGPSRVTVMGER